jgi:hypothetical protein
VSEKCVDGIAAELTGGEIIAQWGYQMIYFKKEVVLPLTFGLCGLLVFETSKPHAGFIAVSPTVHVGAALSSTAAATMVTRSGAFENFTPAEMRIPHDRLVVQTAGPLLPIKK